MIECICKSLAYQNLPNRNLTIWSVCIQKEKVAKRDPQGALVTFFPL